ncbi:MAG TPA: aldo/keto reductase [Gemmataceae bacterium]|nr:aldo/keto reductase [Gemmataceae bacterium]
MDREPANQVPKNCARDAKGTRQHLEDSLRRLQTDYLDLWQFHEINYDNDPDWIVERGALSEALKAQKEGKVRFLGFTGHKDPRIHLKMLAKHSWDTVLMPINVCDYHYRSFAREVVPEAIKRGIAPLGMKSLGGGRDHKGRFVVAKVCTVEEAIRYALSQPIASLVVGIDSMKVLEQDLAIARNFKPLSEQELAQLTDKVKHVAGDGHVLDLVGQARGRRRPPRTLQVHPVLRWPLPPQAARPDPGGDRGNLSGRSGAWAGRRLGGLCEVFLAGPPGPPPCRRPGTPPVGRGEQRRR